MINTTHSVLLIIVMAVVTALIRFLPFLLFPEGKQAPKMVTYLSGVLPCAVIGMLVVYCLKGITPMTWPHGLPEILSVALVAVSYIWKRSTILSILGGTVVYMLLVQLVF
jgi:branched-subunit amino acid transport protein AzlD